MCLFYMHVLTYKCLLSFKNVIIYFILHLIFVLDNIAYTFSMSLHTDLSHFRNAVQYSMYSCIELSRNHAPMCGSIMQGICSAISNGNSNSVLNKYVF